MDIQQRYEEWLYKATEDPDLIPELQQIEGKQEEISDRFYRDLEFGTAGLRGIIGAGTNRMNIYTVRKATQGLADYIRSVGGQSAAIAYDSRIKSFTFAREAAKVLAANGIQVHLYKELMPTPMLSFAVRRLGCAAGIVITASHNPAQYNGYKAYGSDGCQLSVENSRQVLSFVNQVPMFGGAKVMDFDKALAEGTIVYIEQDIIDEYLNTVASYAIEPVTGDLKVIYTPLNGTGNKPVRAILQKIGIQSVTVVPEQEQPDGNFPTAPYPNPEIRQAFERALALAETHPADLLLATDPDADRVGIAVPSEEGYTLMSGNEVGVLLLHYILSRRKAKGTLPDKPLAVKTIVTTPLASKIAADYGCEMVDVLTGFKYIGEQVGLLEAKGQEDRFVFGFEESYGYTAGSYVRDKDAVITSMLICEMTAYYRSIGKTLPMVLAELYQKYGIFYCCQNSFTFEGEAGMETMQAIMGNLRDTPPTAIGSDTVTGVLDFGAGIETNTATGAQSPILLPKSEVLYYRLGEQGDTVIVRPSGTEPKLKIYITAVANTTAGAKEKADRWLKELSASFH